MASMIRSSGKLRWLRRAAALTSILAAVAILGHDPGAAQDGRVATLLTIQGPIGPAVADYVRRGIDKSVDRGAAVIILQMDTPGGLDTSMREIIQDVLASPVPVIGYVGPSGARAASAGTYILYAAHVAAMAPGTNLGAATPVQLGGGAPKPDESADEDEKTGKDAEDGESDKDAKDKDEATDTAKDESDKSDESAPHGKPGMEEKVINDAVAYIRSLAQLRGRNIDWAEKAITEAASLSAEDALAEDVIDLIATDIDDLLEKVDGREVQAGAATWTLETDGLAVEAIERDWRTEFLEIITNPTIAYMLLFTIGIPALLLEFYTGTLAAGVVGAICILLGLYGLHLLPLNYAGLALILLGVALITAEAFVPSVGVLGLGGVASFVVGSVMLIDTDVPGYGISPLAIGAMAVVGGGFMLLIVFMLIQSRGRPVVSGVEVMLGAEATVLDWSGDAGRVRIHGEAWQARSGDGEFSPGAHVRVVAIDGLVLVIEPIMLTEQAN